MKTDLRGSEWNPTCRHVSTCFPALTHFLPSGITGSADKWKPFEDHWPSEGSSSGSRQLWHFYGYVALSFSQRLSNVSGIAARACVCVRARPLISVQCTGDQYCESDPLPALSVVSCIISLYLMHRRQMLFPAFPPSMFFSLVLSLLLLLLLLAI